MLQIKRVLLLVPVLVLSIAIFGVRASADANDTNPLNGGSSAATTQPGIHRDDGPVRSSGPISSGSGKSGSGQDQSSGGSQTQTGDANDNDTTQSGTATGDVDQTKVEDMFHKQGQTTLDQAEGQYKGKTKTPAQIQQICESRQKGTQSRVNGIATNAQSSLTRINKIFSEVIAYQQSNKLTVDNFSSQVSTATTDQATATTAVQALQTLKPTIDCANIGKTSSTSPAAQIATFQAAVKQARTDLLAYRADVRAILVAVEKAAKPAANDTTTTTGGN